MVDVKDLAGRVLYRGGETVRAAVEEHKANLSGADLSRANLSGADLFGADLSGAYLSGADLSRANLSGADLFGADLSGAYLSGADLSRADLSRAYLSGADLSRADLSGADLSRADLSGADLSRAYLSGADLSGADLSGANLAWQSHDMLAEVLRQAASGALDKLKIAGLVLICREKCWEWFATLTHDPLYPWAMDVLAGYVREGYGCPRVLLDYVLDKRAASIAG